MAKSEYVTEICKKQVNEVLNGRLENNALMSVSPLDSDSVKIVVGANWMDRDACHFRKDALADLIRTLQEIHEAM